LKKLIGRVLGEMAYLTLREREVRHGKGKARGRRYKIKRGLLIITASQEKMKCGEFETTDVKHLNIGQLASGGMPGRLVAYTEKAIDELKTLGAKK
jgi:large subunit ribosomal protein L4e